MNTRQAEHNEASKNQCWFCEDLLADNESAAVIEMHLGGFVGKSTQYHVFETAILSIPRCAPCKSIHDRVEGHVAKGGVGGLLLGIGSALLILYQSGFDSITDTWKILIGVIIFFGLIGGTVSWMLGRVWIPKNIKDQRAREKYPLVKQKLEEGWTIGPKPPGL
jgi:hypothetical protein